MNEQINRISVVGCGNIGSRHIQVVAKLPRRFSVEVIEPSNQQRRLRNNL